MPTSHCGRAAEGVGGGTALSLSGRRAGYIRTRGSSFSLPPRSPEEEPPCCSSRRSGDTFATLSLVCARVCVVMCVCTGAPGPILSHNKKPHLSLARGSSLIQVSARVRAGIEASERKALVHGAFQGETGSRRCTRSLSLSSPP